MTWGAFWRQPGVFLSLGDFAMSGFPFSEQRISFIIDNSPLSSFHFKLEFTSLLTRTTEVESCFF